MKKLFIVFMMVCLLIASVFASDVSGNVSDSEATIAGIDLKPVARILTLVVGIFGGIYIAVKTAIDIVHAVTNQDQDPQALRKALIRFIIGVVVIGAFFGLRSFVIGTDNTSKDNAQSVFYQVMSIKGAEVSDSSTRVLIIE